MSVDVVTVKLPVFWSTSPSAWFAQAEAQFAIRSINQDDTRYYHVVLALDSAAATRALSLLRSPSNTRKYDAIKTFFTSTYELSDYERASSLFGLTGLGDSKPSELMDSMIRDHNPWFLQQLPDFVRGSLAISVVNDYCSFAQEADKMYHAGRTQCQPLQEVRNKQSSLARSKVIYNMCWCHYRFCTNVRIFFQAANIMPCSNTTRETVNATSGGPQQQQLFITCTNSGRRFIVDTGAQVLVIPATWLNKPVLHANLSRQLTVPHPYVERTHCTITFWWTPLLCTSHTS